MSLLTDSTTDLSPKEERSDVYLILWGLRVWRSAVRVHGEASGLMDVSLSGLSAGQWQCLLFGPLHAESRADQRRREQGLHGHSPEWPGRQSRVLSGVRLAGLCEGEPTP